MCGCDIMDVIVCAAANALETNFAIYQNIGKGSHHVHKLFQNYNKQDNLLEV